MATPSPEADPAFWGLDIPFAEPADRRDFERLCWQRHAQVRRAEKMDELAALGAYLLEQDQDELEEMLVGGAVDEILYRLRDRCSLRARARVVLAELRSEGYLVTLTHCAARVEPPPCPRWAEAVEELQPQLCDLLEEENRTCPSPPSKKS